MDKGRLKNIIILVLLAVNVFFAGMVILDGAGAKAYARTGEKSLVQVLTASGIKVDDRSDLGEKAIPVCTFKRNLEIENRQVSSIIGSSSPQDQGGNIIMYFGKNGQACFRGTGDFEILMENASVKTGTDPVKTSRGIMKTLGMDIAAGAKPVYEQDGGTSTVTAMCTYSDRPIINCQVTFTYSGDSLLLVTGVKPMSITGSEDGAAVLDISTVVMRFLSTLKDSGYVCSEITDISHCYKMDVAATGDGTLTPLWHFSTDIGDFYINGVTGKQETVTQNN